MAHQLYTAEIVDALCLKLQKIGVGCSFFQYSITLYEQEANTA